MIGQEFPRLEACDIDRTNARRVMSDRVPNECKIRQSRKTLVRKWLHSKNSLIEAIDFSEVTELSCILVKSCKRSMALRTGLCWAEIGGERDVGRQVRQIGKPCSQIADEVLKRNDIEEDHERRERAIDIHELRERFLALFPREVSI